MKISDLLRAQDIVLGLQAQDTCSILAGMAAGLAARAGLSEQTVLLALLRRERLGPTDIGRGIAVPHARLEKVAAPAAMLAILDSPVWFDSSSDDPVDLVLALLWPKVNSAGLLRALGSACRLLRSAEISSGLRRAGSAAEAYALLGSAERPFKEPLQDQAQQLSESLPGSPCRSAL
ncbi:PTS sugar transporter subunit IIA [Mesorhizobium sp. 1B3]|uniref:PTS sugar transporter subunit IIA n=1 Tax=Mesorhizobium sp. 1B3 TaxID=3243599 RepID=UPI003D9821A4